MNFRRLLPAALFLVLPACDLTQHLGGDAGDSGTGGASTGGNNEGGFSSDVGGGPAESTGHGGEGGYSTGGFSVTVGVGGSVGSSGTGMGGFSTSGVGGGVASSGAGQGGEGGVSTGGGSASTCFDANWNGDETDVDCGGSCVPCSLGKICNHDSDCGEGTCQSHRCAL